MKLHLVIGILLIALPCFVRSADNCHTREAFKCLDIVLDWLPTLDKGSIPVNEAQAETMCTAFEEALACAHKFMDACLTPMHKELVDIATEGLRDLRYKFCAKGSPEAAKMLVHAPCLNKVSQMEEMKVGMLYFLAVVEKLKDVPNDKKITYACCGYGKAYYDTFELIGNNCDAATVQAERDFISMIFAQLPDVICNGFTGKEDKCIAVLPPAGSKPTDNLKGTAIYDIVHRVLKNWIE